MMRCICPEDKCTACEACVVVCPKKCIQRQFNEDRSWKLVIEEDKCIGCRRCEKACPNLTKPYFYAAKESYRYFMNMQLVSKCGLQGFF